MSLPKKGHTKDNILDLDGTELDEALDVIIKTSSLNSKPWTEKELHVLEKLYGHVNIIVIAEKLGRTYDSVYTKAKRSGLTHRKV